MQNTPLLAGPFAEPNGTFPCDPIGWQVQPNYFVSVLNNTLTCSDQLAMIGPDYNGAPPGAAGPRSFGHVVRGNRLLGATNLIVNYNAWSVVLEANELGGSRCQMTHHGHTEPTSPPGTLLINTSSTRHVWGDSNVLEMAD